MWYNLAAVLGDKPATENRDAIAKIMTQADVSKAQRLARQWQSGQRSTKFGKRIARVQRGLTTLGYAPGPVDGIFGAETRAAIRAFQTREKLLVTGVISEEFEAALRGAWRGPGG